MVDDRTALMSARALSPGYEVLWYTIDKVLGQGGFGITYLAHDRNLDRAVAIKEYLPTTFAYRHEDYSVKPITGDHRDNFVWGLGSFLKEAQTLARFSHPNVVRVHSVFEENNTAYMVMEYEHGQNLANIFKQSSNLDQAFFEQAFYPIFDGLKEIHKFGFIHRDIKPANIYIREDGTPVLIDFGSARQTSQQQTGEMTTLVSQGYTPLEQYSANYGDQGPWTDIYALAATLYEGIVGRKPEESLSRSACLMRSKPDLLEPLDTQTYPQFSQRFLNAVIAGLKLEPELRPQSLEAWQDSFEHGVLSEQIAPVDANTGTGFTVLEDDRTVLRPPKTNRSMASELPSAEEKDSYRALDDFDSLQTSPGKTTYKKLDDHIDDYPAPPPRGTQTATADPISELDDMMAFDEDDFDTDSRQRNSVSSSSRNTRKVESTNSGKRWKLPAAVGTLVLVIGVAAFLLVGSPPPTTQLSAAALSNLPRPSSPLVIELPEERVSRQLDTLVKLSELQAQAYSINDKDATLIQSIRSSSVELLEIAKQWNASQHAALADKINRASIALPEALHNHERIAGVLRASNQVSLSSTILQKLADKNYLNPQGSSVLDQWPLLSASDTETVRSSKEWQEMISELSNAALNKLAESNFNDAARLTEVGLTFEPDHEGFNELRNFLTSRS